MDPANASAPFSIGQLPAELLLEIGEYLTPIRGFLTPETEEKARQSENVARIGSLHSMCLTCKHLHAISQPLLYQSFVQPARLPVSTGKLLRTLDKKPSLASNVQYIENSLDTHMMVCTRPEAETSCPPKRRDLQALQASYWQDRRYQDQGIDDTFTALLQPFALAIGRKSHSELAAVIVLCRNLTDVALVEPSDLVSATLAIKRYSTAGGLRNLWVKSEPRCYNETINLNFPLPPCIPVSGCLWLSNVNVFLEISGLKTSHYADPAAADVEEIVLDLCLIEPESLEQTLLSRKALKRFTCRWGIDPEGPTEPLDLPSLNTALSKHQDSLNHLVLNESEPWWLESMDTLGSLRHFTALKTLEVGRLIFWAREDDDSASENDEVGPNYIVHLSDILPKSLEEFTIRTEWDDRIAASLSELSTDCPEVLPNLKIIDCSWQPAYGFHCMTMPRNYAKIGVKLRLQERTQRAVCGGGFSKTEAD